MTCIIRKENIICTDSLIFNGGPSSISLEYTNKIKRNKIGTALIIYCGINFTGNVNLLLEQASNTIVSLELNNKDITLDSFNKDLIEVLDKIRNDDNEFFCLIATKLKTYVFKTYIEKLYIFNYDYNDLLHIGSGSDYLVNIDITNKHPVELMTEVIRYVPSCNGTINMFDLNNLKSIT